MNKSNILASLLAIALLTACNQDSINEEALLNNRETQPEIEAMGLEQAAIRNQEPTGNFAEPAAEAYRLLSDIEMEDAFREFLQGKIVVENPYNPAVSISFYSEEDYWQDGGSEFTNQKIHKYFTLLDVNGDGQDELLFWIESSPDKLMYILGCHNDELVAYDIFETHTSSLGFSAYANGIISFGQNYAGNEDIYYNYDEEGKPVELIRFMSTEEWLEENDYDYDSCYESYYLDGNDTAVVYLESQAEYETIISRYRGTPVERYDLEGFSDVRVERLQEEMLSPQEEI